MRTPFVRIFAVILSLFLFLLGGCTQSAQNATSIPKQGITIATSFYPMYIMALNIAKDIEGVQVVNMTQPTMGCLHDYVLTTEDMKNLENADVLIINGAGMESFMHKVLAQYHDLPVIDASQGIALMEGGGDIGENPHVWVSVTLAISEVKNIGKQLMALDSTHAVQYEKNTDVYIEKLTNLRKHMHAELDGLINRDMVTFHEAFPYFAQEFNLNIVGVIEREPGAMPSAKDIADTIATIRRLQVKAVFAEPQYSKKAADTIAQETGIVVHSLDPGVTGPMEADAYLKMMENNVRILKEALQ